MVQMVCATAAIAIALTVPPARADMTINDCRHSDGTPAPPYDFAFQQPKPNEGLVQRDDTCSTGGSVTMALAVGAHGAGTSTGSTVVNWSNAGAQGAYPAPTKSILIYSAGSLSPNAEPGIYNSVSDPSHICTYEYGSEPTGQCYSASTGRAVANQLAWGDPSRALSAANRYLFVPKSGDDQFYIAGTSCTTDNGAGTYCSLDGSSRVQVFRLAMTLADSTPPAATTPPASKGALLNGTAAQLKAKATDALGVYTAQALVDGNPTGAAVVLDSNGGACKAQADGSFDSVSACKSSFDGGFAADVSQVTNGPHQLAVRYYDVSGNHVDSPAVAVNIDNTPTVSAGPNLIVPIGTLRPGSQVSVDPGSWGPNGVALSYQWLRCPPGSTDGCVPIVGATSKQYSLDEQDIDHSVAATVTGKLGKYTTSKTTGPSPVLTVDRGGSPVPGSPFTNPLLGKGHLHNGSGTAESGSITAAFSYTTRTKIATKTVKTKSGKKIKRPVYKTTTKTTTRRAVSSGRFLTATGKLVGSDGAPIGGAVLSVIATPQGGTAQQFGQTTTKPDGTYSFKVAWGPIRRLQVGWYPFGDSTAPIISPEIFANGTARVIFSATRSKSRRIGYTGRVVGAPAGTIIRLQVRSGRNRWSTFASPRTIAGGTFASTRRLTATKRGTLICARARAVTQSALPYVTNNSRTVCKRLQ